MPYRVGMILSFYIRTPLITRTNVSHRKYVCDIWDILEHRFKPFILVCWKYSSIYGEQNKSVDANAWLWIFVLCMNEWMNEWMKVISTLRWSVLHVSAITRTQCTLQSGLHWYKLGGYDHTVFLHWMPFLLSFGRAKLEALVLKPVYWTFTCTWTDTRRSKDQSVLCRLLLITDIYRTMTMHIHNLLEVGEGDLDMRLLLKNIDSPHKTETI